MTRPQWLQLPKASGMATAFITPSFAGQLLDILQSVAGFPHRTDGFQHQLKKSTLRRHVAASLSRIVLHHADELTSYVMFKYDERVVSTGNNPTVKR